MKSKLELAKLLLLLGVASQLLVGCSKQDTLIGKWQVMEDMGTTIQFFPDGRVVIQQNDKPQSGRYALLGHTNMTVSMLEETNSASFSFRSSDEVFMYDEKQKAGLTLKRIPAN